MVKARRDGAGPGLRRGREQFSAVKHPILFLAANPTGMDRLALDREASAIQDELERASCRDSFEFVMRWAAEPIDLLREVRKVKPTVVHFSGHGTRRGAGARKTRVSRRDVVFASDVADEDSLCFQESDGRPCLVSASALRETFAATGASVRLVVLNACTSDTHTRALLTHVDCVVGVRGSIADDAGRHFARGFYGGLAERASIAAAFQQGRAAIRLAGLRDHGRLQLQARNGVDASQLVLASLHQPWSVCRSRASWRSMLLPGVDARGSPRIARDEETVPRRRRS